MIATANDYKQLWEKIDKIQEDKVQSRGYSARNLTYVLETTEQLLNSTSNNAKSAPIFEAIKSALGKYESVYDKGNHMNIVLKLDSLKNAIHAMWEYGLSDNPKWSNDWKDIFPPVPQERLAEYTREKYPLFDSNTDKQTQDKVFTNRYFFFHGFFRELHPELEYPFENYMHDHNNEKSFTARTVQTFDNEVYEAYKSGKISADKYIDISRLLNEWVQNCLFVGEGTYTRDEVYKKLDLLINACYEINAPDIDFDFENKEEVKQAKKDLVSRLPLPAKYLL